MAYIYKIINDINDKIYIGKTNFSIEKRWREHCNEYMKARVNARPLYRAIKKYGIEHFHIEEIEKCSVEEASIREKYWIEYYGSFKYGYNATIGGDGKPYIDYDLVYATYQTTHSIVQTAQLCHVDSHHVSTILSIFGVTSEEKDKNRRLNSQKPVARLNKNTGEILEVFSSIKEAENKYPQTNKHIAAVCKGKRKSCGGYGWKYLTM